MTTVGSTTATAIPCQGEGCDARLVRPLSLRYELCAECRLIQQNERGHQR